MRLALQNPEKAQNRILRKIIRDTAKTARGKYFGARSTDTIKDWKNKLPISDYGGFQPFLESQMRLELSVLVPGRVKFYEKTSGSSGPVKFVPYNKTLKRSFGRLFLIWLKDLIDQFGFKTGKVYLSVSPGFFEAEKTTQGIPVGLQDDTGYLGFFMRSFLNKFTFVPSKIKKLQDPANFRRVLACCLLAEENLEVISIWNPSLFETILDEIETNRDEILAQCEEGRIVRETLTFSLKPISGVRRQALLRKGHTEWQRIWPHLLLVSAWDQGSCPESR